MTSTIAVQQMGLGIQALAVALQHPAVAEDQRNICRMLQVCKAWRALVQRSAAGLTAISLSVYSTTDLVKLSSFTGWLARHRGLICSLDISGPYDSNRQGKLSAEVQIARQLLNLGMQAATSAAPPRLRSYKSTIPPTAGFLAALPAATLTYLDVSTDSSNWFSCLSSLSSLRHLCLDMARVRVGATDSCLHELGKLQQLRRLQLDEVASTADTQLLPAQLQHLQLSYQQAPQAGVGACIKLQHLTALQKLQLTGGLLAAGSTLPPNLQSLCISAEWPADGLVGLSSLQRLTGVAFEHFRVESGHLRALEQLPQLEDFRLDLSDNTAGDTLVQIAAAWQNLPLMYLAIPAIYVSPAEVQQLMQHMSTATKLTELSINVDIDPAPEEPRLAVFENLKGLSNLQKLYLSMGSASNFTSEDAQHLSALTALTELDLACAGCGPPVDATTLSLLALRLTRLKVLAINLDSGPDERCLGTSAFPAIRQLTTLESLHLEELSREDARRGLKLLTGLSRLRSLTGFDQAGREALESFWDTVAKQQGLT